MNFIYKLLMLFIFGVSFLNAKSGLEKNQNTIPSIVNVFGQVISFDIPIKFLKTNTKLPNGFKQENKSNFLLEIVPYNQTLNNWDEIITISGTNIVPIDPSKQSENAMNYFKTNFRQHCPDTFSFLFLNKQSNKNEKNFVVSCGNIGNQSESTLIKAIKSEKNFYTIQWSFHDKPSSSPIKLNEQEWSKKLNTLNPRIIN